MYPYWAGETKMLLNQNYHLRMQTYLDMLPFSQNINLTMAGHMLEPNPTFGLAIFSANYPPYPYADKLCVNPTLPTVDKEYSTNDNLSTEESVQFSDDDDKAIDSDDSEQSYV